MAPDRTNGLLLIIGALGMLLVAAFHPTGHQIASAPDPDAIIRLNGIVHGTAITSLAVLIAGAVGLTRWLGGGALPTAALAFFALAGLASITAAVMSGFVAPDVFLRLRAGGDATTLELLAWYSWRINQAFARVHMAGSAVAIVVWSIDLLHHRGAARAAAAAGLLIGAAVLLPVLGGITLDVHAFGALTLGQSLWLVWLGVLMLRPAASPVRPFSREPVTPAGIDSPI